jgi:hypothetical protein
MRRTSWGLLLVVAVLGGVLAGCSSPNRGTSTQPSSASGFLLDLTASPNVVRGVEPGAEEAGGCSNIQAKVFNTKGELVDGALVDFTATGCCFVVGTEDDVVGATFTTTRGVANITWCANFVRGTTTITATVEDAFDTVLITVI